jgi:hypothetical protein
MASVFDKKQPSLVADIMSGTGAFLKGAASNIAGIADLVAMSPVAVSKMIKGDSIPQAVQSSAGLLTNALGLQPPAPNSFEALMYKTGQVLGPVGKPVSKAGYGTEVAVNTALQAANDFLPENSGMTIPIAAGLFAGSSSINALRNKMIKQAGFTPEAAAAAKANNITLGQQTGNPEALRKETALAVAPSQADKVKSFYTQQAGAFESNVRKAVNKLGDTQPSQRDTVRNTFDNLAETFKNRQAAISTKFGKDLDKFYDDVGGFDNPIIPSTRLVDEIDEIITTTKASVGSTGNETLIKEMEKIRGQLVDDKTSKPRLITGKEFKEQQSYWSKASASTGSWLDGVDANTAKPLAAKMVNAMDETFNLATQNYKKPKQVKALKDFQAARQEYREAVENMKDYAALPVNRLFDAERVSALKGEDIIDEISKYPPETLASTIKYLQEINPEVVSIIRGELMDNIVKKGVVTGAAEQSAKFDTNAFLKAFDEAALNNPNILNVMLPNVADQTKFKAQLTQARKIANSKEAAMLSGANPAVAAASDIASLGGGVKARVATRGLAGAVKDTAESLLLSDKKMFDMLFQNKDIRASFMTSYNKGIAKTGGQEAAKIGGEASKAEEAELQRLYQEYLEQQNQQGVQPDPASETAPEPSLPAEGMQTPPMAPQGVVEPSTGLESMTDEQLQKMYLEFKGLNNG